MNNQRQKELIAIHKFIHRASIEERASIISEICNCNNVIAFNRKYGTIDKICSVRINEGIIELSSEE